MLIMHQQHQQSNQPEMEHSAVRDNENPHWIGLLRHVRQLNDELRQLADFHLGNNMMATITDHEKLPKATSNTANACLEVTDATCVVMATMRAIVKRQKMESGNIEQDDALNCQTINLIVDRKNSRVCVPNNDMLCVLSCIELALSMSQKQRGSEVEHLLRHAICMIKNAIETDKNKTDDASDDVKNGPTKRARTSK